MSFSVMKSGRTRVLLSVLAMLALVGASCGGGSTSTADDTGATATSASTETSATTAASDSGADTGDADAQGEEEAPTAIPDPTATPVRTAIPDPTATPVPTATAVPTAAPEVIVDEGDREAAIAEIMADEEVSASRDTAECMVDGVYDLVGSYNPQGEDGFTPEVQEMVADCIMGGALDDGSATGFSEKSPGPGSPAPGEDAELDALWNLCNEEDGAACDSLFFEAPIGSVYEAYGFTCGGRVDAQSCTGLLDDAGAFGSAADSADLDSLPEPGSPAPGDDPELDALWELCNAEDAEACDDLFFSAPVGSVYEDYGFTCGARVELADCAAYFAEG